MRTPRQPYVLVPVLGVLALLSLLHPGTRGWVLPAESLIYDAELRLGPETQAVRAGVVQAGDRIVAVNGVPVATPEALHARVARSASSPAQLHLQSAPLRRTLRVDGSRLDELLVRDPDPVLFQRMQDGVDARIEVEALRALLEAGPPEAVVVWEQGERVIQGPIPLERLPIPWSGVLLVFLGVVFSLGIIWRQVQSLSQRERARLAPPLSALLGGVAAGGLLLLALPGAAPPGILLWMAAGWVPWWLIAVGSLSRKKETPAWLVVAAVLVAVAFVVLWLGDLRDRAWAPSVEESHRLLLVAALLVAVAHLGLAVRESVRTQGEPIRRVLLWVSLASWGGAAIWHFSGMGPDPVAAVSAGALGALVPLWLYDAFLAAWRPVALTQRPTASEGLDALLGALGAHHTGPLGVAWGTAGAWRLLRWEAVVSGEARVSRLTVPQEDLASALSMLEVEGGTLPSARASQQDDEDPFLGLRFREPVAAILPIDPDESSVMRVFVVFLGDQDEDQSEGYIDLEAVDAVLGRVSRDEVLHDLRLLVPGETTGPDRVPDDRSTAPAELEPVPSALAETSSVGLEVERLKAWVSVLERARCSSDPMEGLDALTEGERAALDRHAGDMQPVLVLGEPGLGKRFVAHALHQLGPSRQKRYALVDAAAMPPAMLEAELFGAEENPGLVDALEGGTLALHSLSALPSERLSRVLEALKESGLRLVFIEREMPDEPADIPAAIARWVGDRVVHLVPLRERPADLLRHADAYLARFAMHYGKLVTALSSEAEEALRGWPAIGNLSALRERMRTAVLQATGDEVLPEHLGLVEPVSAERGQGASDEARLPEEEEERQSILDALEAAEGNKSEAARLLGISRGKLLRRIDKLSIDA